MATAPTELDGVFTRPEAVDEFHERHEAGEHVLFIGPTGRGKTTWARSLLERPATDDALVLSVKGADKALSDLGRSVKTWPKENGSSLRSLWERKPEPPRIHRWEASFETDAKVRDASIVVGRTLAWLRKQNGWTLYIPDLQIVSDPKMMGWGKPLEILLLTARSRGNSIWMDAQAPRWIPRAACDQISHLFIFQNRDRDTVRRLREIAGLDMAMIEEVMSDLSWHEVMWIDVKHDQYFVVEEQ